MDHPLPVLVNESGGTAASRGSALADEITRAFEASGRKIDLRLLAGSEIADAAASLSASPEIVVGGGDGTLASAAGALIEAQSKAMLGILPLGTRNHFARDLNIPADLVSAAALAGNGTPLAVDAGEVNGRVFLNNASIGLYPALVKRREAVRRRHGFAPKWLAALPAASMVLARARHHRLRLTVAGDRNEVRTPLLFVGNNRYAITPGRFGRRTSLSDGLLSVFALEHSSRIGLLALALRTLAGRTDLERDLAAVAEAAELEVRLHGASVDVALDGEVVRLDGPLRFSIRPGALRVRVPAA